VKLKFLLTPKNIFLAILLIIIVSIGLKYRLRSYDQFPPVGSTFDEQVYAWIGASVINTGVPTGWSFIEDYLSDNRGHIVKLDGWSISYDGQKPNLKNFNNFPKPLSQKAEVSLDGYSSQFTFVQPDIEQPPFGALLSGFLSGSFTKKTFSDVTLKDLRIPVIILSSLSIILVFLIANTSYGLVIGFLSSLIFALTPSIVITQRLAVAENYLTFFLLSGVFLLQYGITRNKNYTLFLTAFLIVICYLIKPFGIMLSIIFVLALLVFNKNKWLYTLPVVSTLLGMGIFYLYGNFYDAELFKKILSYQTGRYTSPLHGIFKIVLPKITSIFLDGWIIFGWLSAAALLIKHKLKQDFWVVGPIIAFLLMFMLYGGEDYGWYRLLVYPFLSIASAYLLISGLKESKGWVEILFVMTVFSTSVWWGLFGVDWVKNATIFRILTLLLVGIFMSVYLNNLILKYTSKVVFVILIIITFWLNIQTTNNMQIIWPTLREESGVMPGRR
jgi:4-amino-4-deoxy-L-arabinose transferase-like glycosyltransferase